MTSSKLAGRAAPGALRSAGAASTAQTGGFDQFPHPVAAQAERFSEGLVVGHGVRIDATNVAKHSVCGPAAI